MKIETIKAQADRVISLSDIEVGTFLHKFAKAGIKFNGYYGYTDAETNEKVFVS